MHQFFHVSNRITKFCILHKTRKKKFLQNLGTSSVKIEIFKKNDLILRIFPTNLLYNQIFRIFYGFPFCKNHIKNLIWHLKSYWMGFIYIVTIILTSFKLCSRGIMSYSYKHNISNNSVVHKHTHIHKKTKQISYHVFFFSWK